MPTCVVLLVCCSCRPSPTPPPSSPPTPPPEASVRVACRTAVANYCAGNPCDQTLTAAEQNRNLCPATFTTCGDVSVAAQNKVDTSTLWYYERGQLVAVVNQMVPGPRYVCLSGPEVFSLPPCTLSGQSLPACGP